MPLVPTVTADGNKICELARAKHGTVTAFAAELSARTGQKRHPGSFWNMRGGRTIGEKFAAEIAGALDVEVSDITLTPETGRQDEATRQQGEAA